MARQILKRIGQIEMSQPSIWRCTQAAGEQFDRVEKAARVRACALPAQGTPPSRAEGADPRMGVALDGALIHLRQEG